MTANQVAEKQQEFLTLEKFLSQGVIDINLRTLRSWCLSGKYSWAKKRGKYWYINTAEFMKWFNG